MFGADGRAEESEDTLGVSSSCDLVQMTKPHGTRGSGFTRVFAIGARMAACSSARERERGGFSREDEGIVCAGGCEGLRSLPFKEPASCLSGDFRQ
jgi:hypothetical protein